MPQRLRPTARLLTRTAWTWICALGVIALVAVAAATLALPSRA